MEFYQAEDYHGNYYNLNKSQPYCNLVISPKVESFQEKFKNYLKINYFFVLEKTFQSQF